MYTNSIEEEMDFLLALSKSAESLKIGEKVDVTTCPNCNKGTVVTYYKNESPHLKFQHYCNNCGEVFNISELKADLFFNSQCWMLKELTTPFGTINVTVNNSNVDFRYFVKIHKDLTSTKSFVVNKIEIDTSKLTLNDIIRCPFPQSSFHLNNLNGLLVFWCENDEYLLSMCAYVPAFKSHHCYSSPRSDEHGLYFTIDKHPSTKDPLILALACLDKSRYDNVSISILSSITDIWRM